MKSKALPGGMVVFSGCRERMHGFAGILTAETAKPDEFIAKQK
jgi:hypothetical protein